MDLTWDIKQNFIFGYSDSVLLNLTHAKNIEKIYMFDLDYTLISKCSN